MEYFLKSFYETLLGGGSIDSAFADASKDARSKDLFGIFGDGNQTPYQSTFEKGKFLDMNNYAGRYRLASPIYTFFARNTLMCTSFKKLRMMLFWLG